MKTSLFRGALFLALISCGDVSTPADEAVEKTTGAQLVCPPDQGTTPPPPDPCAYHITRLPDATLTMGANVTEKEVHLDPPDQASCPARVIVVSVPSTSSPNASDCGRSGCYDTVEMIAGAGFFPGSVRDEDSDWIYIPKTQTACTSYFQWSRLYKKASGASSYVLLKERKYHGYWENGTCFVKRTCGPCATSCPAEYFPNDLHAQQPPTSGTDYYRIVTNAKAHSVFTSVRVKAGYEAM